MSISDIDVVENQLDEVTDTFVDMMRKVFDECPEAFDERTSYMDWHAGCAAAGDDLREELNKVIAKFENKLHQGEY